MKTSGGVGVGHRLHSAFSPAWSKDEQARLETGRKIRTGVFRGQGGVVWNLWRYEPGMRLDTMSWADLLPTDNLQHRVRREGLGWICGSFNPGQKHLWQRTPTRYGKTRLICEIIRGATKLCNKGSAKIRLWNRRIPSCSCWVNYYFFYVIAEQLA